MNKMINAVIIFTLMIAIGTPIHSQKRVSWALDLFPLDASNQVVFNFDSGFKLGIEGEVGVNFSNYILASGAHFSSKSTLIRYQQRDEYGNERYYGVFGLGVFTRIRDEERIPFDIGLRSEYFIHFDDSDDDAGDGLYNGVYIKAFTPIKHKIADNKRVRKISLGVRMSAGIFTENALNEFGVMGDVWIRFHLK